MINGNNKQWKQYPVQHYSVFYENFTLQLFVFFLEKSLILLFTLFTP